MRCGYRFPMPAIGTVTALEHQTGTTGESAQSILSQAAALTLAQVLPMLQASPTGLNNAEAELRLEKYGPNEIAREAYRGWPWRLLRAARNPLVILLCVLAILSVA